MDFPASAKWGPIAAATQDRTSKVGQFVGEGIGCSTTTTRGAKSSHRFLIRRHRW